MGSAAFTDAYVHYLTQFPTQESLGSGDPPAAWKAALDAVTPLAFDQVKALNVNLEGGGMSGVSNFEQVEKVRALHAVRSHRDATYVNPYSLPSPEPMVGRRMGSLVRFGF